VRKKIKMMIKKGKKWKEKICVVASWGKEVGNEQYY